jgi:hypothetical protein
LSAVFQIGQPKSKASPKINNVCGERGCRVPRAPVVPGRVAAPKTRTEDRLRDERGPHYLSSARVAAAMAGARRGGSGVVDGVFDM